MNKKAIKEFYESHSVDETCKLLNLNHSTQLYPILKILGIESKRERLKKPSIWKAKNLWYARMYYGIVNGNKLFKYSGVGCSTRAEAERKGEQLLASYLQWRKDHVK